MMFGGILIALNKRVAGGFLVLLAFTFLLLTQDNPMLIEHIKPKPRMATIRMDDLARHVSVMGAILYVMVVPPSPSEDAEHAEEKKSKKKTN
jgi:hypothetical protein